MAAIITDKFAYSQLKRFVESLDTVPLYLGIGKSSVWADEELPDVPSFNSHSTDFSDLIAVKRITSLNIRFIVPRVDWSASTTYSVGNYVLTSDFNVYYCKAASGQSLTKPTSTSKVTPQSLDSGNYSWQYLYTIVPADTADFVVSGWIPAYDWNGTDTVISRDSYNPAQLLNSNRLMMSVLLSGTEGGDFPAGSGAEYRKIVLLQSPLLTGGTTVGTASTYNVSELQANSGSIIYKDYRKKIIREATQKDNINIILEF